MSHQTQVAASHVQGLFFAGLGEDLRLCFALAKRAKEDGRMNYTLPGGRVERGIARWSEPVKVAMVREFEEETGGSRKNITLLRDVGAPVVHCTGKGEIKYIQGFAGVVTVACTAPRAGDEIAAVHWLHQSAWLQAVQTMNHGKQQLVLCLMEQATQLRRLPVCIKQGLFGFLQDARPAFG